MMGVVASSMLWRRFHPEAQPKPINIQVYFSVLAFYMQREDGLNTKTSSIDSSDDSIQRTGEVASFVGVRIPIFFFNVVDLVHQNFWPAMPK